MITLLSRCFALILLLATTLHAQVPQLINYQGRVVVDGVNFDGAGQFKFALVNASGSTSYWSNDGSSVAGGEPTNAVTLAVSKGLYSVLLGDATLPNMTIVPATVFANGDVHLRVWFNDGVTGFQQLTPDRRIAAVGYAMMADSVVDGAVTTAKIADGAVTAEKLAAGVVQSGNIATSAVGSAQLATDLTLGGITTGTFSGSLTGNVTGNVSGSAASFLGTLMGEVTGTQGATVITDGAITPSKIADGAVTAEKMGVGAVQTSNLAIGAVGNAQLMNSSLTVMVGSGLGGGGPVSLGGNLTLNNTGVLSLTGGGGISVDAGTGAITLSSNATSEAIPGAIIACDHNGGFSAGTVSAQMFVGNGAGLRDVRGTIPWVEIDSPFVQARSNTAYLVTSTADVTITLPLNPNLGDIVRLVGGGTGQWRVVQGEGQYVNGESFASVGANWTARGPSKNWEAIAASADGMFLLGATWSGFLYTSHDAGITWTERASSRLWSGVASSTDGMKLVAVVRGGFVYTSDDRGVNWVERATSRDWSCVASSGDGNIVFAADTAGAVFRSLNAGVSWVQVRPPSTNVWRGMSCSSDGSSLLLIPATGVLTFSGLGDSWSSPGNTGGTRDWRSVSVAGNGSTMAAASENEIFVYTSSGGVGWQSRFARQSWQSVSVSATGLHIAALDGDGSVYVSSDRGLTWTAQGSVSGIRRLNFAKDGRNLLAWGGGIPLQLSSGQTSIGAAGGLIGGQASAIELLYVGDGKFIPLSSIGPVVYE